MLPKEKRLFFFALAGIVLVFLIFAGILWQMQQSVNATRQAVVSIQMQLQHITPTPTPGGSVTVVPSAPVSQTPKNLYRDDKYHFEITFPETWPKFQVKRTDNPSSGVVAIYGFTFEGPFNAIDLYITNKPFEEHLLQDYPLKWRDNFKVAAIFNGYTFYYQDDASYFECAQLSPGDCAIRKQIASVMRTLREYNGH